FLAAFINKKEPLRRRESVAFLRRNFCCLQGQIRQKFVEIISSQIRDAVRCYNRMLRVPPIYERNIEGSAAEIVIQQTALRTALPVRGVAIGKLNRRCGRFIRQSKNGKSCGSRCFFREKP